MIRSFLMLCAAVLTMCVVGQTGWSPLSREVERPYAVGLEEYGSEAHTAVRPYATNTLKATIKADSLLPMARLRTLDTWAGRMNGRKFRWGPLMEAVGGYEFGTATSSRYRASGGFWSDLDVGTKLNFHLDAQAWTEQLPAYLDTIARATQVTAGEGYAYRDGSQVTHYDWSGHMSWDAHKYINLTLGRGKNSFGDGYRSLFLSDETWSYPYFKISTTFWHIKYVNLFSMMDDIRKADGVPSNFQKKFSSMHYLSWNASKRLNFSVFEAIMWSNGDETYPRGFDVNYLNPIIFYRPVEFQLGSPDNALLGFASSVKAGKHVLFYAQFMLDEFLLRQVREGNGWYANKQAVQLGVNAHEAFGVQGLHLRAEWNYVRPFMYTHSDTRQNYAHFGQALAHPYGSNVQEVLAHADLDRKGWVHTVRVSMAWMGTDSVFSYGNNIFRPESDRPYVAGEGPVDFGYDMGDNRQQTVLHVEARSGWTVDPRSGTRLEAGYTFRLTDPAYGNANTTHYFRAGLVCHFRERHPEQARRYILK
ncbi:MAG: hypothetical protein R2818_00415 [Flavobacteriales bacterium]